MHHERPDLPLRPFALHVEQEAVQQVLEESPAQEPAKDEEDRDDRRTGVPHRAEPGQHRGGQDVRHHGRPVVDRAAGHALEKRAVGHGGSHAIQRHIEI